jgi:hypothetical protein
LSGARRLFGHSLRARHAERSNLGSGGRALRSVRARCCLRDDEGSPSRKSRAMRTRETGTGKANEVTAFR